MKLHQTTMLTVLAGLGLACNGGGGSGSGTDSGTGGTETATDGGSDTSTSSAGTTTEGCEQGTLGCSCGAGGFCTSGLICLSTRCVVDPAGAEECGNGNLDPGEECDLGVSNADTALCRSDCKLAFCGDGFTGPGEACDDGNDVDNDTCTSGCALPTCGDAIQQASEECDDGNADNDDACLNTCVEAICGDGIVQTNVEDCDDANLFEKDGCLNDCTFASLESCGDGTEDPGEVCFAAAKTLVVGLRPVGVDIGTFNADAFGDVAAVSSTEATLTGWSGVGGGNFLLAGDLAFELGSTVSHAAFLDVNNDGNQDVVAVNSTGTTDVAVMTGSGINTMFTEPAVGHNGAITTAAVFIEAADIDGNAFGDALIVRPDGLTAMLGAANPTFVNSALPGGVVGASVCLGDVNGDDSDEAIVIDSENGLVAVMAHSGGGAYTSSFLLNLPFQSKPRVCATGDLNGDGADEVIVSDWNEVGCDYDTDPNACPWDTVTVLRGNPGPLEDGFDGKLAHPVGQLPWDVHIVDMDGDGKLDVVTPNGASGDVSVLHGDGLGWFDRHDRFSTGSAGGDPAFLAFGELNADGLPDMAVTRPDNNAVSVLLSDP